VVASIIVSSSTSAAGGFDPYATVGLGVGGVFVAVALVYAFAYLDLLAAAPIEEHTASRLRATLLAVAVPLVVAFGGIVLFRSLQVVGGL
jgi:hypothetical protein